MLDQSDNEFLNARRNYCGHKRRRVCASMLVICVAQTRKSNDSQRGAQRGGTCQQHENYVRQIATKQGLEPGTLQFVTNFNALIMVSHSPSGAPYAEKTICSVVSNLFDFIQSYGCPQAPHHQKAMLFFFRLCPW